jgi:acyl-CoA thioester hydrolase
MMSKIPLHIRPSDCDQFGHVNNAVYVSFLQQSFLQMLIQLGMSPDWTRESECFWAMPSLAIEYRQAAQFGDRLAADIWLVTPDHLQPVFGVEITREAESSDAHQAQALVRAQAVWQRIARNTGKPVHLSKDVLATFPLHGGSAPRPFQTPADSQEFINYFWEHQTRRTELGPHGTVHLQTIYHWLEESVFAASAQAGWPPERRIAAGFFVLQLRHDTEVFALPEADKSIRVTSRLIDVRRFRGTWRQEIHQLPQERLLVQNYSTGIFVDQSGRPSSPSPEMMNDIQFGASS